MTLSILLTSPWDSKSADTPPSLDVPKVRPHRFSWRHAGTVGYPRSAWSVIPQRWAQDDDGGSTDEAEVITSSSEESTFLELHGREAKDVDYDKLGERITDVEDNGILDVIKEMALQHPDAMWFVRTWSVEPVASD